MWKKKKINKWTDKIYEYKYNDVIIGLVYLT